jgi:hypothetical protein
MTTFYVSQKYGNDKWSGSKAAQVKNLSVALSKADANGEAIKDIIVVRDGVFTDIKITTSNVELNTLGKEVDIKGTGAEYGNALTITGHHVEVDGDFEFYGAGGSNVKVSNTHHITIRNTESHHAGTNGYYFEGSDELLIERNESHHNGSPKTATNPKGSAGFSDHMPKNHGVDEPGYDIIFKQNWAHHNSVNGISDEEWGFIEDGVGKQNGSTIYWNYAGQVLYQDNVATDNGKSGFREHYAKNITHSGDYARSNWDNPRFDNLDVTLGEFAARSTTGLRYFNTKAAPDDNDSFGWYTWGGTTGHYGSGNVGPLPNAAGMDLRLSLNDWEGDPGLPDLDHFGVQGADLW